jgi:hypothetical protein
MELQHCLCFVEQHHIFDSYYHGGRERERGRQGGSKKRKSQGPRCAFHGEIIMYSTWQSSE